MSIKVRIHVSGDKEVIKALKGFSKSIKDWQPEMKQIGEFLEGYYRDDVFETEGGVFGRRWAKLQPAYELAKRKQFGGRGILEKSGDLRKGFRSNVRGNSVDIENKVEYATFHQSGTSRMAVRAIIDINEPIVTEVATTIAKGIKKRIEQKFG